MTNDDLQAVALGDPRFAVRLHRVLAANGGNVFHSPASIRVALGMTYSGAAGTTAEEIARTLSLDVDARRARRGFGALRAAWRALGELSREPTDEWDRQHLESERIVLRVVSRMFGQRDYSFRPDILETLATDFGAPLCELDFRESEAARTFINEWVEEQTEQKIRDLLGRGMVNPDTRMILCNAVYFKARWRSQFSEVATRNGPFFLDLTRTVDVPLMSQVGHYEYGETDHAQIISLPYGDARVAMLLIVPRRRDGLAAIEAAMDDDAISRLSAALSMQRVRLTLPRFRTSSSFQLAETLSSLGMRSAFEFGAADFSPMDGTRLLYVSEVVHQAFIEVDEHGTEAAAATAMVAVAGGPMPKMPDPIELRVDRPFLYAIRDVKLGTILFMGRLADPSAGTR